MRAPGDSSSGSTRPYCGSVSASGLAGERTPRALRTACANASNESRNVSSSSSRLVVGMLTFSILICSPDRTERTMFRNILISVDGSPHSEEALRQAIDIASAGNGRLTILTAVPKPSPWAANPAAAAIVEALSDELEHEFTDVSRHALSEIPESIPVTTIVTHEPIRLALEHQIESGKYDLLVM